MHRTRNHTETPSREIEYGRFAPEGLGPTRAADFERWEAVRRVAYIPGTKSVGRVPDLVVESLSEKTHERDAAPRGAKYLAYEASGVREYYYCRPDGRAAAGFVLRKGRFIRLVQEADGFSPSPLLGCRLRLVEAATSPSTRKR